MLSLTQTLLPLNPITSRKLLTTTLTISGTAPPAAFNTNLLLILLLLLSLLLSALLLLRCFHFTAALHRLLATPISNLLSHKKYLTGRKAIKGLPTVVYTAGMKLLAGDSQECAICLSEFVAGEAVRVLPGCNHVFHVGCIDEWLVGRPTCPTCRRCLFATCQKVKGGCRASEGAPVAILPLPREGLATNYQL